MTNFLFRTITIVFQPLFVPLYLILLYFCMDRAQMVYPPTAMLYITLLTVVYTILLPIVTMLVQYKLGTVTDYFLTNRKERLYAYISTFLGYIVFAFHISDYIERWLFIAILGAGLGILMLIIINFWWKISAHMSGMGGFLAVILLATKIYSLSLLAVPIALLISASVASSRLYLKAHTPAQLTWGYISGFLVVFVPVVLLY